MIKCIVIDQEQFAIDALLSCIEKIHDLEIIAVFTNAFDAMPIILAGKVDLVFCDIQMPDINGISFLKALKKPPLFIFVTRDPSFAVESYELEVLDYIMKPFTVERLLKAVNRARAFLESDKSALYDRNFLVVKDKSANVIVPYDEILFIKSDKDYLKISTEEKVYTVYMRISELEAALSHAKQFVRIQKSYMVNLDYAKALEDNCIRMKGSSESIPIGGQYKAELYLRLGM